ncbi:MAG: M1 family peptidase, partial [Elusimicrobia bacterium]|nr:M1 family peptidase [Elusimicrobiota bacterium]
MARSDPHSYFDDAQPRTRSWRLDLRADFDAKTLSGEIELALDGPHGGALDLDTKGLDIRRASVDGLDIPFELGPEEPILGRRLRLTLPPGARA